MSAQKKRHWAFIAYPESMPEDFFHQLQLTGLQGAISPLHDRDINPTGEEKKHHYHVIVSYSGPTSYNVVKSLTSSFNCSEPKALEQVRGYYRYLTHKDNPEKAQYSDFDIKVFNGFNISDFVEITRSEVLQIKRQVQSFIRDKNILEYSDLMDTLFDNEMNLEYEVSSNNTYFFEKYISSRRNKFRKD